MDQLLAEIEAYAAARGIKPATVVQYATNQSFREWDRWKSGGGCSVKTAQKIREYMSQHSEVSP